MLIPKVNTRERRIKTCMWKLPVIKKSTAGTKRNFPKFDNNNKCNQNYCSFEMKEVTLCTL